MDRVSPAFLSPPNSGGRERFAARRVTASKATTRMFEMKGIILWLMGVPLIVIILLYMFVF
ncbi:hypothetical protein [Sinorhizobium arboris]|uniref:hypothetical protein n=1 Tax=Sinorhizobium arboris TaxID=76745 RepID=UPI0003FD9323|nr:hypothetical protein [Sinorhizobium arboris]